MASLDFDAARKERQRERDADPVSFTLGGRTFRCRSAFALIDVWSEPPAPPEWIDKGVHTDGGRVLLNLTRVIADYIVPEQRDEWWELFEDDTEVIEAADIVAVSEGLTKEYTGRPLSPSGGSSNGLPETTGSTSSSTPDATSEGTSST